MISGMVTGLAGALAGQLDRQVTTQQLHWLLSAQLAVATVPGGTRDFFGPIAGAFALVGLREIALRLALYHNLVLGILLVVAVLVLPAGLVGAARTAAARLRPATRTR